MQAGLALRSRFAADEVRQIRFERHDSLLNGTLIGLAAGAVPGIVFIAGRSSGSDPIQDAGIAASIILVPAVAAAGVGALMDALFFEHRIVYKSTGRHSRRQRIAVAGRLGKGPSGLVAVLTFRFGELSRYDTDWHDRRPAVCLRNGVVRGTLGADRP